MISTLPIASSLANLFTIPTTTAASALGISPNLITPAMEEELRKQIMSDIKRTGTYSGGISYEDLGFDTIWNKSGEHIDISKNPFFRNPTHGIFSPQQAIGLTGGKMDWSADPITGEITWDGGKYDFGTKGSGWVDKKNAGWNPDLTIDPALMKKEIDAFSPHERWRQGQIQIADPVKVYENSPDHYKMKFQENKVPFEAIPDPWKPATGPTIFEPTTPVTQPPAATTWTPPPTPTQRNVTKFSPTRSTAIRGGRGGRGNVGGNRMKAGTSRNYGVTGKRIVGGR